MTTMKPLRKIQIAAASALVGFSLCGCNQQPETTGLPPATQSQAVQSTPQVTEPTSTNQLPASTLTPSSLPETMMANPTNNPTAPTPAPSSLPETTPPTSADNPTAPPTPPPASLPETAIQSSTNQLPTAAPIPDTQQ
jgi:hypothetical protein